jgi:hypothetical protein
VSNYGQAAVQGRGLITASRAPAATNYPEPMAEQSRRAVDNATAEIYREGG